jgi:hypothetical protein
MPGFSAETVLLNYYQTLPTRVPLRPAAGFPSVFDDEPTGTNPIAFDNLVGGEFNQLGSSLIWNCPIQNRKIGLHG